MIKVDHDGQKYRVVFEYVDADGSRFKKRDNSGEPKSWHRHPRSCHAYLEMLDEYGHWFTVGYAASYAHDGENFDRAEGREIALLRLINLLPEGELKDKFFAEAYRATLHYRGRFSVFSCDLDCTGLNVKGQWIPFWMELEDEA